MLQHVKSASKYSRADRTVVAWAERFPHLDQNDVLGRYREVVNRYPNASTIIRLTSDCPMLTSTIIDYALSEYFRLNYRREDFVPYYNNRDHGAIDGHDVQICSREFLFDPKFAYLLNKEHVFQPPTFKVSVDTLEDLNVVRSSMVA